MLDMNLSSGFFRMFCENQQEKGWTGTVGTPVHKDGYDYQLMWAALDILPNHHIYLYIDEEDSLVTCFVFERGMIESIEKTWRQEPAGFIQNFSYKNADGEVQAVPQIIVSSVKQVFDIFETAIRETQKTIQEQAA